MVITTVFVGTEWVECDTRCLLGQHCVLRDGQKRPERSSGAALCVKRLGRVHTRPPGEALCVRDLGRVHKWYLRPRGAALYVQRLDRVHKRHSRPPGAALCVERWTEATRAILWGGTMCEEIGQSPHTTSWGGTVCKGFGQSPQVILAPSWGGIVCTEIGQSPQATLAASWGGTVCVWREWAECTGDPRGLLGRHLSFWNDT